MKKRLFTSLMLFSFLFITVAQESVILPKPQKVEFTKGDFKVKGTILYASEGVSQQQLTYFIQKATNLAGNHITFKHTDKKGKADLLFVSTNKKSEDESYKLSVGGGKIAVNAHSEKGVFYAMQSLLQLLSASKEGGVIPNQTIDDAPRFSWRAFMLDESRYFKGEEEVLRLLEVMAELKMNIFHWHLTDDQGWRVESKIYPKLTEIGSKRNDTQIGGWNSPNRSGEPHEGYYTQEQIKRIVKFAQERHIKIVPEIEMPGHASAAIASYPWLGTKQEQIEVPVVFGKLYAVYNVIDPKVKTFLREIVSEMITLFQTDVIHIGGDEVRFNHWEEDLAMQAHKKERGYTSFMDIQIEFTNEMSNYIADKGVRMMGWNEILGKNLHADDNISFDNPSQKIAKNVLVHFWKGDLKEMEQAAREGYQLINSHHRYTYLDYPLTSISLENAYGFDPIPKGLPAEYEKNIYGLGCQMWGEWIPTVEAMNNMIYPRIAAYAEVGWSTKEKNYDNFKARLQKIFPFWIEKGIQIPIH